MKPASVITPSAEALEKTLLNGFDSTLNKARAQVLSFLIIALCKVQTVNLFKLANVFNSKAKPASSMRRIQRFLKDVHFDFDKLAMFIVKILPFKGPFALSMDRTNWKFGKLDINALFIGICYQGVAFPLMFSLLEKKGNSNTPERIALIERFVRLFGKESIDYLVADREFVGHAWLKYLNKNGISYHIRIKENFYVTRNGKTLKVREMFRHLKMNECECLKGLYTVNGEQCYLSATRCKDRNGKPELKVIVSLRNPGKALSRYKKRWQIEACFKAMKTSGFNIEDTHLVHLDRIAKLFGVMMIAYTWAYLVGIHEHDNYTPLRRKTHGRREKSLVKYGLELIANALSNCYCRPNFDYLQKLSCT